MFNFGIFFVIITSVVFWYIFFWAFVQICRRGLGKPEISLRGWAKQLLSSVVSEQGRPHIYIKIVIFALTVRFAMLALGFIILLLRGHDPTVASLFQSFVQGDAHHYLNIAEIGYGWTDGIGANRLLVFFPLYPYLVRLLGFLTGSYLAEAYIVSVASYCLGLIFLYRLVRLDYSEKTAWWAVVLISVFPHSFFFGTAYTESLFLLTTVMTLFYIRTHKWHLAGIAGALAASTRMVGIILVIVAAVEFITHYKLFALAAKKKWTEIFSLIRTKAAWILLMFAGSGFYIFINWLTTGDPFRFLYYQESYWDNTFQYFGAGMLTQFANVANPLQWGRNTTFAPNILAFAFSMAMLAYAHIKKLNITNIVYTLGYIFISFSPAWLLSGGRYAAACATLFIFFAHMVENKSRLRIPVLLVSFAGLIFIMGSFIVGGAVF
jgi:hypothetical protein